MSKYKVGIISEGPLDQMIIKSIIKNQFPEKTFVFSNISPTEDEIKRGKKDEGFGWGGVYKVCKDLKNKIEILKCAQISYDLIVIHIDGDVMFVPYESAKIHSLPSDLDLPCYKDSFNVPENCAELNKVVLSWLADSSNTTTDNNISCCIPYINSDTWFAYILYKNFRNELSEKMSKDDLDDFLLTRSKNEGRLIRRCNDQIKKNSKIYRETADMLTTELLQEMKMHYSQLNLFCDVLSRVIQ